MKIVLFTMYVCMFIVTCKLIHTRHTYTYTRTYKTHNTYSHIRIQYIVYYSQLYIILYIIEVNISLSKLTILFYCFLSFIQIAIITIAMYSVHCTLYAVQCTLYSVQCTLFHCKLYTKSHNCYVIRHRFII